MAEQGAGDAATAGIGEPDSAAKGRGEPELALGYEAARETDSGGFVSLEKGPERRKVRANRTPPGEAGRIASSGLKDPHLGSLRGSLPWAFALPVSTASPARSDSRE